MSNSAQAAPVSSTKSGDVERYRKIFEQLDTNKDGQIQVGELAEALKRKHVPEQQIEGQAQDILQRADQDSDQNLDFSEFVTYMKAHEKQLRLAFKNVDRNKDGQIDPAEVKVAFSKLGISIDEAEAIKLTKRIDQNQSLSISWEEWRDYLELHPNSLEEILLSWRHSLMIDIGEQLTCPPEFTEKEKVTGKWWRQLVAGGVAGAISRTATAPLDRLKVLLQVHGSHKQISIVGGFQHMIKEGGMKSLWRGNGTNVIKIAPETGIKFMAYEQLKKVITGGSTKNITPGERFIAGASAGAIAQTTIYPMEVIKTKLAVSKTGEYRGILDCGMKTMKNYGLRAMYRGYVPNLIGIIPYAGIDLTVYETLKMKYINSHPDNKDPGTMVLLGCGTLSSTCGQLSAYPLALIRTKLQAAATKEARAGMVPLVVSIMKNEGPLGFYRGILPNFMKVLPAVSISYVMYEKAKKYLNLA